tara:strand:+ start:1797 stop:1988 length:192 start_codon:yes stop_codon:yes gene_type:complete
MSKGKKQVQKSIIIPKKYKDQYLKDKEKLKKESDLEKKALDNKIKTLSLNEIKTLKSYLLRFS